MCLKGTVFSNMYSKSDGIVILTIYPDEEVIGAQEALCKALWCKYRKHYDHYKQSDGVDGEVQPKSINGKSHYTITKPDNFDFDLGDNLDGIEEEDCATPYVYIYHFSPDVMETILAIGFDEWLDRNLGESM